MGDLRVGDRAIKGGRVVTITSISNCGEFLRHSNKTAGSYKKDYTPIQGTWVDVLALRKVGNTFYLRAEGILRSCPMEALQVSEGTLNMGGVKYSISEEVLDDFWKNLVEEV